jgi:acyl carrier protein phosphodiesterase
MTEPFKLLILEQLRAILADMAETRNLSQEMLDRSARVEAMMEDLLSLNARFRSLQARD